jgi:hypothetical protein
VIAVRLSVSSSPPEKRVMQHFRNQIQSQRNPFRGMGRLQMRWFARPARQRVSTGRRVLICWQLCLVVPRISMPPVSVAGPAAGDGGDVASTQGEVLFCRAFSSGAGRLHAVGQREALRTRVEVGWRCLAFAGSDGQVAL